MRAWPGMLGLRSPGLWRTFPRRRALARNETHQLVEQGKQKDQEDQDEQGSALVELALVVALLGVPLLLATGEVGPLLYDAAEVENAAHAGALYGMQSSTFAADALGMITAAQTEAVDFGSSLTVVPVTYYACATAINGTQYTGTNALSSAQSACTGTGNHPLQFVQVSTTLLVSPVIRCPGLATTFTLTGSSVMEVEQ